MRHSGFDRNGKCEFVIPLHHEFKNKSQCIELINAFLNNCRDNAKNEDDKEAVKKFRGSAIGKFYDSYNVPDVDAYAIHNDGVCFFMKRHTNFENWKHSFNLCRYDTIDYEIDPNGLEYEIIRTEFVPEGAEYEINHDFDQEMFKKSAGNNGVGSNKIIRGSNVYVKRVEKKEKIEKIKSMKEEIKAKQCDSSENLNVKNGNSNVKPKQKGKVKSMNSSKINSNSSASNQLQLQPQSNSNTQSKTTPQNSSASNQPQSKPQNSNASNSQGKTIAVMCGGIPLRLNLRK